VHGHGYGPRDAEESGVGRVDVECQVVNQDGEAKLTGTATAAVPRRG
jgi:acyl dehydratase